MNHPDRIKEYRAKVEQAVDVMLLSDVDIKRIVEKYFAKIVEASKHYEHLGKAFQFSASKVLEREVNDLITDMQAEIFDTIYSRSYEASQIVGSDDKDGLLMFLLGDINGETLLDRISMYTDNISKEFETYVAIGIGNEWGNSVIISTYLSNLKHPYQSSEFNKAIEDAEYKTERIRSKGISFGVGKTIAAYGGLKILEQDTIYKAYNHSLFSLWQSDSNIIGWYTVRGSNYPCPDICDPMVGVFHPITEKYMSYHTRCVCIAIPVYKSDL